MVNHHPRYQVSPCNPIPWNPIPSLKVRCRCAEALGMVKSGEESRVSRHGWLAIFGGRNSLLETSIWWIQCGETGGNFNYRWIHHPSLFPQQIKSTFFRIFLLITDVFKTNLDPQKASLMGLITFQEEAKALVEARGSRSSLPETNRRRLHKKT